MSTKQKLFTVVRGVLIAVQAAGLAIEVKELINEKTAA